MLMFGRRAFFVKQQQRRLLSSVLIPHVPPVTKVTTLGNGFRVATERSVAECETATVGVWIDAGSRYEAQINNGAAHFLEHMAFKGTRRRSQRDLEVMIEDMGAHLNAYTSREQTVYYAKLFKHDARKGVEVLSDILQHSLLEHRAIERERDVILREMEEVNKQREELLLDLLHAAAYENGGLGRTILGPEENIQSLSQQDLKDYIETHYTAPRMLVVAAGNVDHQEIVDLGDEFFGKVPQFSKTNFAVDFESAVFTPKEVRVQTSPEEESRAHVCLAFESANWSSAYATPIMVLQHMLGQWDRFNPSAGGIDSPYHLTRVFSEKELCHSYMHFNTCYRDTGLFGVYLVCPPETVGEAIHEVLSHFATLDSPEAFDQADVDRAKAQVKANIIAQLDALAHVCEEIGRQILTYNRRITLAEVLKRIDAITAEDVRATARHILKHSQGHALAAYGQIQNVPDYQDCHISNH